MLLLWSGHRADGESGESFATSACYEDIKSVQGIKFGVVD